MKIKIMNCGSHEVQVYRPRITTVAGLTKEQAINLAVRKFYGKRAFFWRDNGLRYEGIFGQICEPLSQKLGGGNTCITGRVRIDIDE